MNNMEVLKGKETYKILNQIQQGNSANVYLVEGESSKQIFSMKILSDQVLAEHQANQYYEKEIQFIQQCLEKKLNHRNIVNFQDLIIEENQKKTCLVQDFCDSGNLFQYILKNQQLTEESQLKIAMQIAKGIQWLHQKNIIHRDIKPESILLSKVNENEYDFKISDFGYSAFVNNQFHSIIGTINYMAPEVLKQEQYEQSVDIWGLGCTFYELSFRKQLFNDNSIQNLARKILNFTEIPEDPNNTSYLLDVIKHCLNVNPQDRITIDQVIEMLEKGLQKFQKEENGLGEEEQKNQEKDEKDEVVEIVNDRQKQDTTEIKRQFGTNNENLRQQLSDKREQKRTYDNLMSQFQDSKKSVPKKQGFFQSVFSAKKFQPIPFTEVNGVLQLVCEQDEKFYSNFFHFLISGQLLTCLQNHNLRLNSDQKEEQIDSFQLWVSEVLQISIEFDKNNNQFPQFQKALSQMSFIGDIFFRINSYLQWIQDQEYCQQAEQFSMLLYQAMTNKKKKLSQTVITVFETYDFEDYIKSIIKKGGFYDCWIQKTVYHGKTIYMQPPFRKAIEDCLSKAQEADQKVIKQVVEQFRATLLPVNLLQKTKEFLENQYYQRTEYPTLKPDQFEDPNLN